MEQVMDSPPLFTLFPCSHFYLKRKEILFSFLEFLTVKMKDDWETLGN